LGLSWNGIIIGGLGAAVALWPLAATAWDLLGLTTGQAWRLVFLGACALVLAAGVVGASWKRASPVRLVWLILTAWLVAAGAVAALTALAWLVLGTPDWQPLKDLTPKHLDAIATRAFAIVAGLGGVALLVIAYRRQRTTENGEQREITKLFNERFTTAYSDLGSEHAAVRLGAVNALAHLADDAPSEEEVQMVIDVLCAYLRMPYTPRPDDPSEQPDQPVLPSASPTAAVDLSRFRSTETDDAQREKQRVAQEEHRRRVLEFESFQQVRHTIIRIIGNHLREPTRWRGKNYDFTGVVFDGGDLHDAHFVGGEVSFSGAEFTGGTVYFSGAKFTGGEVYFFRTKFTGGQVHFLRTKFTGGTVSFFGAEFTGGQVNLFGAEFTGGTVSFSEVKFTGGTVYFFRTKFTGGQVNFFGAEFTGGTVYFSEAEFTGGEVNFITASGSCPKGLLEAVEREEPRVVVLPEQWQPTTDQNGGQEGASTSADTPGH
jgi:uncharacterized protein YjbI with pentapeptide repeats